MSPSTTPEVTSLASASTQDLYRELLVRIGEDTGRDGLIDTPKRMDEAIHPQGVGVILEAQHLCMMMRGVEKQHSATVTSAMRGVFKTQQQTRSEFLSLVRRAEHG